MCGCNTRYCRDLCCRRCPSATAVARSRCSSRSSRDGRSRSSRTRTPRACQPSYARTVRVCAPLQWSSQPQSASWWQTPRRIATAGASSSERVVLVDRIAAAPVARAVRVLVAAAGARVVTRARTPTQSTALGEEPPVSSRSPKRLKCPSHAMRREPRKAAVRPAQSCDCASIQPVVLLRPGSRSRSNRHHARCSARTLARVVGSRDPIRRRSGGFRSRPPTPSSHRAQSTPRPSMQDPSRSAVTQTWARRRRRAGGRPTTRSRGALTKARMSDRPAAHVVSRGMRVGGSARADNQCDWCSVALYRPRSRPLSPKTAAHRVPASAPSRHAAVNGSCVSQNR